MVCSGPTRKRQGAKSGCDGVGWDNFLNLQDPLRGPVGSQDAWLGGAKNLESWIRTGRVTG